MVFFFFLLFLLFSFYFLSLLILFLALYLYTYTLYNRLLYIAASEAGYDDISEPEDGLISNEDEMADLVDRTRAELGHVIRNPERPTHRTGKPLLNSCDCRV